MRNKLLSAVHLLALFISLILFSYRSYSQSISTADGKFEVGLGLGPMFFLGDLGGTAGIGRDFIKDLDFPLTTLSKSIYANVYPSEWIGFRIALNHGILKGDDAEAPNKGGAEVDRLQRNLSFKTSVLEAYLAAEFYPTVFFEQYDGLAKKFRPYGIIGVGGYKYNPKAKLDGQWVELHPLRLEGQGMAEYPEREEYSLLQLEVPMGFGFKYYVKENMYVGMEVLHRQLFTDYVDDVSTNYVDPDVFANYLSPADAAKARRLYYRGTYASAVSNPGNIQTFMRGDPTDQDAFFSTILRVGWRLGSDPNRNARRQMRCPVFY